MLPITLRSLVPADLNLPDFSLELETLLDPTHLEEPMVSAWNTFILTLLQETLVAHPIRTT